MKRKSDSIGTHRWKGKRESREVDEPEIQPLWPSFADLPFPITSNILLRLHIKSVLICKCVCKSWHTIISDPRFAKLHFKNAPTEVMIRTNDPKSVSRTLHLLEFQPENIVGRFNHDDSRFCMCDNICKPNCQGHMKFEAKFKLPLRDAKMVLDKMLEAKNGGRKRSYIACKPRDDKFAVVNSCMGLLCLCDPMHRNPLVVCNPITGEFTRLPETSKILRGTCDCGFGYHIKTGEFKVIRVYDDYAQDPSNAKKWLFNDRVAEMHTLGTGTWKSLGIGSVPYGLRFPTSVNGELHWLRPFSSGSDKLIVRFNFELEMFENFPSPLCLVNNQAMTSWYGFNFFNVCGTRSKFEAFAYTPSLIPLKVAEKGDVEVHNVHSRCAAFKLREENDVLFLAEDNVPVECLYSSSSEDESDSEDEGDW
ncbi:F-box protein interaction domain protein [Senna tora]|uniref:F-box protein interaction domain protein n=1 Tax=Senna tora TaxID=362788 RepID=A0A834WR12_9FABA|nr:F-box protein interaction domain protein [Senna tora]